MEKWGIFPELRQAHQIGSNIALMTHPRGQNRNLNIYSRSVFRILPFFTLKMINQVALLLSPPKEMQQYYQLSEDDHEGA